LLSLHQKLAEVVCHTKKITNFVLGDYKGFLLVTVCMLAL